MDPIADQIVYLYACDMNAEEIAERLGVNMEYVAEVLARVELEWVMQST